MELFIDHTINISLQQKLIKIKFFISCDQMALIFKNFIWIQLIILTECNLPHKCPNIIAKG